MELNSYIARHSGDEVIVYKTVGEEKLACSIYYPPAYQREQTYKTLFLIHGGGWRGRKIFEDQTEWSGDYLGYLARYYADGGYVCISVDYRMAQEDAQKAGYQLWDLYEDCKEAVDYILNQKDRYGIDMNHVSILGESAGGHLAGLVATKYQRSGFAFERAYLVNPITYLNDDAEWGKRIPKRPTHEELANLTEKERGETLSPLYQIGEDTCPVVLIHGTDDTVVHPNHTRKFYERMKQLSLSCEMYFIEGANHAFLLAEYTDNLPACKKAIEILNHYL